MNLPSNIEIMEIRGGIKIENTSDQHSCSIVLYTSEGLASSMKHFPNFKRITINHGNKVPTLNNWKTLSHFSFMLRNSDFKEMLPFYRELNRIDNDLFSMNSSLFATFVSFGPETHWDKYIKWQNIKYGQMAAIATYAQDGKDFLDKVTKCACKVLKGEYLSENLPDLLIFSIFNKISKYEEEKYDDCIKQVIALPQFKKYKYQNKMHLEIIKSKSYKAISLMDPRDAYYCFAKFRNDDFVQKMVKPEGFNEYIESENDNYLGNRRKKNNYVKKVKTVREEIESVETFPMLPEPAVKIMSKPPPKAPVISPIKAEIPKNLEKVFEEPPRQNVDTLKITKESSDVPVKTVVPMKPPVASKHIFSDFI